MTHSEALEYLENCLLTVTNGIFTISGFLFRINNMYYVDCFGEEAKFRANVEFDVEDIESIDVNETAFLSNVSESERHTIVLKG